MSHSQVLRLSQKSSKSWFSKKQTCLFMLYCHKGTIFTVGDLLGFLTNIDGIGGGVPVRPGLVLQRYGNNNYIVFSLLQGTPADVLYKGTITRLITEDSVGRAERERDDALSKGHVVYEGISGHILTYDRENSQMGLPSWFCKSFVLKWAFFVTRRSPISDPQRRRQRLRAGWGNFKPEASLRCDGGRQGAVLEGGLLCQLWR